MKLIVDLLKIIISMEVGCNSPGEYVESSFCSI